MRKAERKELLKVLVKDLVSKEIENYKQISKEILSTNSPYLREQLFNKLDVSYLMIKSLDLQAEGLK